MIPRCSSNVSVNLNIIFDSIYRRAGRESVVLVWEEKKEEEAVVQEILQHLASLHAAAVYRTVNNSALVKQVRIASDGIVYMKCTPIDIN